MKNRKLAEAIYNDINKKGAGLGNASIIIIEQTLDKMLLGDKITLAKLYNAIKNDASIQHMSLGWSTIIDSIERLHRTTIIRTDEQFTKQLLLDAIVVSKGILKHQLEAFARELDINIETLRNKPHRKVSPPEDKQYRHDQDEEQDAVDREMYG